MPTSCVPKPLELWGRASQPPTADLSGVTHPSTPFHQWHLHHDDLHTADHQLHHDSDSSALGVMHTRLLPSPAILSRLQPHSTQLTIGFLPLCSMPSGNKPQVTVLAGPTRHCSTCTRHTCVAALGATMGPCLPGLTAIHMHQQPPPSYHTCVVVTRAEGPALHMGVQCSALVWGPATSPLLLPARKRNGGSPSSASTWMVQCRYARTATSM